MATLQHRSTLLITIMVLLIALLLTGAVSAQRGGRGRGNGTPIVPEGVSDAIKDAIPQVTVVAPDVEAIQATAQSLLTTAQNATNWSELLEAIPDELPTLDTLDLSQLPYDLALDDLEALLNATLQSSSEAYAALVGFAAQNLGIGIAPLYAGDVTATVQTTSDPVSSAALDAAMQQVLAEFPPDVQAMMAQAATISGKAYWGLMQNGAAVLYADVCQNNPNCAIDLDMLQVQIANSSLGVYGLYVSGAATGLSNEALSLIQMTYPALAGLSFVPIPGVPQGYAFMAQSMTGSTVKLVYAGVVSYAGQSLVYAGVITGEAYIGSLPIAIPQF